MKNNRDSVERLAFVEGVVFKCSVMVPGKPRVGDCSPKWHAGERAVKLTDLDGSVGGVDHSHVSASCVARACFRELEYAWKAFRFVPPPSGKNGTTQAPS